MKVTPAEKRALEEAVAGKFHPVGSARRRMMSRLIDRGLLRFYGPGLGTGITDAGRALVNPKAIVSLTRAQMRIFKELREHGMVFTEDHRELTYQPLLDAGFAYESQAGQLRISPKGETATILHHNQVLA